MEVLPLLVRMFARLTWSLGGVNAAPEEEILAHAGLLVHEDHGSGLAGDGGLSGAGGGGEGCGEWGRREG